jgi:hypothetical protein
MQQTKPRPVKANIKWGGNLLQKRIKSVPPADPGMQGLKGTLKLKATQGTRDTTHCSIIAEEGAVNLTEEQGNWPVQNNSMSTTGTDRRSKRNIVDHTSPKPSCLLVRKSMLHNKKSINK